MKQPFPDRESTLDAFARHVSRGKVAFFKRAGLELVAGEREGPFYRDVFAGRIFFDCRCNVRRRPYPFLLPGPVPRHV